MDGVITLLSTTITKNDYGVEIETLTAHDVFCIVLSVTRTEFYTAGRNGLNPEFVFKVFVGDYAGERTCEYEGKRYAIYRTYVPSNNDYIELYVQREGGTNGESDT